MDADESHFQQLISACFIHFCLNATQIRCSIHPLLQFTRLRRSDVSQSALHSVLPRVAGTVGEREGVPALLRISFLFFTKSSNNQPFKDQTDTLRTILHISSFKELKSRNFVFFAAVMSELFPL